MLRYAETERAKQQRASDRRRRVNMLDKDIRRITCHHIAQQAAADTGDDTDEDREKHICLRGHIESACRTRNGKDAETDGICQQHQNGVSLQKITNSRDEDDEAGEDRCNRVDRVVKHRRREGAEDDISCNAAADRDGQTKHAGAEDVHVFANAGHRAGDGDGGGSGKTGP